MNDARNLVDELCTRAGMIMEDATAIALTTVGKSEPDTNIGQILLAASDVACLADAASVILRRAGAMTAKRRLC